jgi:hypothetical protein
MMFACEGRFTLCVGICNCKCKQPTHALPAKQQSRLPQEVYWACVSVLKRFYMQLASANAENLVQTIVYNVYM